MLDDRTPPSEPALVDDATSQPTIPASPSDPALHASQLGQQPTQLAPTEPAIASPDTAGASPEPPAGPSRRTVIEIFALTVVVIIALVVTVSALAAGHRSSQPSQVELPFTGLSDPQGVAVDAAGNVYVTDAESGRVLKLPAGSNAQVELSFTALKWPAGVGVDSGGNVYLADASNNRVVKLPAQQCIARPAHPPVARADS